MVRTNNENIQKPDITQNIGERYRLQLPQGFTVGSEHTFQIDGTQIKALKVNYKGKLLDFPIIVDDKLKERLTLLQGSMEKYKKILQQCRNDQLTLFTSCKPYPEKDYKGHISPFIDNNFFTEDTQIFSSETIRKFMGVPESKSSSSDDVINALRKNGLLPFDPNGSPEKNSLANTVIQSLEK